MADEIPSSGNLWFVTLARDALDEGHRVIAHNLNAVLRERALGVRIKADPIRERDSLRHAAEQFRTALPGLRTRVPLPPSDYDVIVWTLGYINDKKNSPCFVTLNGIHGVGGDFDLGFVCTFLLKRPSRWSTKVWQENIQAPVMEQYSKVLADLQEIEADAAPNISREIIETSNAMYRPRDEQTEPAKPAGGNQPACDEGISLFDLAFLIEEDDTVATQRVKQWIDSKGIKAESIGKCPLDGRRSLYRLSELLSDVGELLALDAKEKTKYRQALTAKLRTPGNR